MSNYRRVKLTGACYFFTVVTYRRWRFLTCDSARQILNEILTRVKAERPFIMPAICLLSDHLHCIWQMPSEDADYSTRWSLIKRLFSQAYTAAGGTELQQTSSRLNKRELGIWQRRFWEHRIRDETDYWHPMHYIHYNPIKHGLVERIEDWPYSTYHQLRSQGIYDEFDWAAFESDDDSREFVE